MERWRGKVAIVTGGSAGIGLSLVQTLVKHGIVTVAASRRPHLVDEIRSELTEAESALLHSLKCDVTEEEDVKQFFEWIEREVKTVHILINNAGVITAATLIDGPIEQLRRTVEVNLMGLCIMTKYAVNLMERTGVTNGHVIHINSVGGHKVPNSTNFGHPVNFNIYPATKFAVSAMTDTLRMELHNRDLKIKVTSLSPGLVKTDMFEANGWLDEVNYLFNTAPYIEPKHVAEAVIYVLSTPAHVSVSELVIQPLGEFI